MSAEGAAGPGRSRRRDFLLAVAIGAIAFGARSAPVPAPRRLGILWSGTRRAEISGPGGVLASLSSLGWIEGRGLEVVARYLDWEDSLPIDRIRALVESNIGQVLAARVDAVLAEGTGITLSLRSATPSIPIVTTVSDPVGAGLAKSLAKPGGNVTGLSQGLAEIAGKHVELLRAVSPRLARLLIVRTALGGSVTRQFQELTTDAARRAGLEADVVVAPPGSEAQRIREAARGSPGAAYVMPGGEEPWVRRVAQAAVDARLPTITLNAEDVERGLLVSYRLHATDAARRLAAILDKVLRGTPPGEIPFELPTRSELVVNKSAAASMGLALPADILLRTDRVIE